jgi:AAHS family 3-hydroxyphenylpropionic acid transporter
MNARMPADAKSNSRITLVLCTAAALFEGFDNQSIGVAAPRITQEFVLTAGEKGLVFSAAAIGLTIGAAFGGRAADFLGRQRTLIASLLLFGSFSLVTAFATTATSFFIARLLTGLGLGGAMPNFIALSSEAAHPSRRLSATTIVMGGTGPIAVALLMMCWLPDAPRPAKSPEDPAQTRQHVEGVWLALFGSRRAPTTLLLWTAFFFTQLLLLLMLNWLPSLMIELGFTATQASWMAMCFNLSGSVGAVLLGRLHAGAHRRLWVILTYSGIALALAVIPAVGSTFVLAAMACGFAGIFIVGAQLILFALAPLYYESPIRGTGVGASVAIGRVGSVVGPLFAGALLAGGGNSTSVLLGILPFVVVSGTASLALTWRTQASE